MFHVKHRVILILVLSSLFSIHSWSQGVYSLPADPFVHAPPRDSSAYKRLASNPSFLALGRYEMDFFQWVNIFRQDPVDFRDRYILPFLAQFPGINGPETVTLLEDLELARTLEPLIPDPGLNRTSRAHALDLSRRPHILTHNSSNGASFRARMEMAGIRNCAGENLYDGKNDPLMALIILLVDKGVANAGHRKALMRQDFRKMGVSIKPWKGETDAIVLVQDFSCD